jgi:hypothetical protein
MLSGAGISWRSKKQTSVALSTAKTEYIALSSSVQEAIWLKQLTLGAGHSSSKATVIYEDNQSAISLARNTQFHIRHHFVRVKVSATILFSGTAILQFNRHRSTGHWHLVTANNAITLAQGESAIFYQ